MKQFLLIACLLATSLASPLMAEPSLYQRLGELSGITRIVDNLLYEIAEDPKVLPLFANTDIERFREKLIEQLCQLSDGPCTYTGDTMTETHRHLDIQRPQFNSLVEDLIRAMEAENIPTGAQNALLARLVPLYDEVTSGGGATVR